MPPPAPDLLKGDLGAAAGFAMASGWLALALLRAPRTPPPPTDVAGGGALDDSPAVAHALSHSGGVTPSVVAVVVLDLARRGYLEISEERRAGGLGSGPEWCFRRLGPPEEEWCPYETAVFTRLFAAGDVTSLSTLRVWARANQQQARVFLERVRRSVTREAEERGYAPVAGRLPVTANLLVAAFVFVVGVAALAAGAWIGLAAVASAIAQARVARRFGRRLATTAEGAPPWKAIRHAIGDPEALDGTLDWNAWLVYAASVDGMEEFLEGLRGWDDRALEELAPWYEASGTEGRLGSIARFPAAVDEALSDAVGGWTSLASARRRGRG